MANTRGEKELKIDWPIEEGTTARTTKQTGDKYLHADNSIVLQSEKIGLGDDYGR